MNPAPCRIVAEPAAAAVEPSPDAPVSDSLGAASRSNAIATDRPPPAALRRPLLISGAVHALLLAAGWMLVADGPPAAAKPEALAHVGFVEPRAADLGEPAGLPPERDAIPEEAWTDTLEVLASLDAPEVEAELPEPEYMALPERPRVEIDVPMAAIRVRVRPRRPAQPPVVPPARRPPAAPPAVAAAAVQAPPPPALRVVYRPAVSRYYPERARRAGIEGTAVVDIRVDRSGRVVDARIHRSSGSELLDAQALRMLYDHRFAPGAGGRARRQVVFSLD